MGEPSDFRRSSNLLVIGGGDGMGLWEVKRLFAERPEIESIVLADIKPLLEEGRPDGQTNPGRRHLEELKRIEKPIHAVLMDYERPGSEMFAAWKPVNESAEGTLPRLSLRRIRRDYDRRA